MIIESVSELRNYNNILEKVKANEPVILTKNGKGTHAIIDINDIDEIKRLKAYVTLFDELMTADESGYTTEAEFLKRFA